MTEDILFRFFAGTATDEETDRITAWMEEDPDGNRTVLNAAHEAWVLSVMAGPASGRSNLRGLGLLMKRYKVGRYAAGIAASLLVCFGANYLFFSRQVSQMAETATTIEAPAGQRIRFTLGDGSVIDLNSGGSISYPAVFTGKERRVKLTGEAMFDVAHDAKKPFIVETFSYEVKVLGTKFNVIANEDKNEFSTTLLEGKVAVSRISGDEEMILEPNTIAELSNGRLVRSRIGSMDDYLWLDGVISLSGLPFDKLTERLEKAYNVRIVLARETVPVIKYTKLKVRVSDGIDHVMRILSLASDFTYEYDTAENTITVK